MKVNKKLGRLRQWAGERMGGEVKTTRSDDFKALEAEMDLRHEGLVANHKAMTVYVKALSKRSEGEDKSEKVMPVAYLGTTMTSHGEDFENDSDFGNCLIAMGRTQERISRIQESYISQASSTWLQSLERSLVQMKEYQSARKKLENRRLAYDTAQTKLQKAKREDYRAEEEARAQKAKYDEASEDIIRRMQDIQEAESENLDDLGEFLEAELNYYARCHEALLQLKRDWPTSVGGLSRTTTRSFNPIDEEPQQTNRATTRSICSNASRAEQFQSRECKDSSFGNRTTIRSGNDCEPVVTNRAAALPHQALRSASDSLSIRTHRAQLRHTGRDTSEDVFEDPSDHSEYHSHGTSSPDGSFGERSTSPATSIASSAGSGQRRKPPPPPPPSRKTKPPPPPPVKRSSLSSSQTIPTRIPRVG